jgi:hypothetical protein
MFGTTCVSTGNPDKYQDPNQTLAGPTNLYASTLVELGQKVKQWQEDNDCGGGNWARACVVHNKHGFIGIMSYNGRVWTDDDDNRQEITDENYLQKK